MTTINAANFLEKSDFALKYTENFAVRLATWTGNFEISDKPQFL